MNKPSEKFNIDQYTKPRFDLIVELGDEVEYLLDKAAVASIKNNESVVILKRLIDGEIKNVAVEEIVKSLQNGGPIDYLKTK